MMININFKKTLTAGVALATALYPQAFAGVATPCGEQAGDTSSNCWSCGDDCSARLDSTGKLSIYGSGTMNNYDYRYATSNESAVYGNAWATTAPWGAKIGEVTSIDVQGVTNISTDAFLGMKMATSINIGNSVTSIGIESFDDCNFSDIYIPPSVTSIGDRALSNNPNLTRVVSSIGYIVNQNGVSNDVFYKYKQEGGLIYMYDKDNNIKGIFDSQSDLKDAILGNGQARIEYDSNGNFTTYNSTGDKIMKYAANGDFIAKYIKGADGSTAIYDANGKLTGLKNAKSITPAQAAALVKKGNHNRVTLTFK